MSEISTFLTSNLTETFADDTRARSGLLARCIRMAHRPWLCEKFPPDHEAPCLFLGPRNVAGCNELAPVGTDNGSDNHRIKNDRMICS